MSHVIDVVCVSRGSCRAFSGALIRFLRYSAGLKRRGVALRMFTASGFRTPSIDDDSGVTEFLRHSGRLTPECVEGAIPRVKMRGSPSSLHELRLARALYRYCRESQNRPDVLHLLAETFFGLPYILALRRMGIPVVLSYTLLGNLSDRGWKRQLQRLHRRLPLQCVDCIVAPTVVARDVLRGLGVTTPIEVIPNGVDLRRFRPPLSVGDKRLLRKQLGLDPDGEIILFVGAFVKRKGVDILLHAWQRIKYECPKAQLVFVGPSREALLVEGNPAGIPDVEAMELSTRTERRVLFTGRVANVEDYLQAADLLVFPSEREGMPNAVLEAYASGLAVVMTPFLGLSPELGRPGKEYILVERNPRALGEAIVGLLRDPQHRQEIGCQARRWAEMHLDLETALDQYASLYHKLLQGCRKKF